MQFLLCDNKSVFDPCCWPSLCMHYPQCLYPYKPTVVSCIALSVYTLVYDSCRPQTSLCLTTHAHWSHVTSNSVVYGSCRPQTSLCLTTHAHWSHVTSNSVVYGSSRPQTSLCLTTHAHWSHVTSNSVSPSSLASFITSMLCSAMPAILM